MEKENEIRTTALVERISLFFFFNLEEGFYICPGLGEVQRWSEIPPCRESNAADERDKLVAKLLDEIK